MSRTALAVRADGNPEDGAFASDSLILREILPSSLTSMVLHIALLLLLAMWLLPEPKHSVARPLKIEPLEQTDELNPELLPPSEIVDPTPQPERSDPTPLPAPISESQVPIEPGGPSAPRPDDPPPSRPDLLATIDLEKFGDAAQHVAKLTKGPPTFARRDPRRRPRLTSTSTHCPESENAVKAALRWLAAHQNADGSWSYDHRDGGRCNCGNPGQNHGRFGSTALALLAFLGAGETHQTGSYRPTVDRGLKYLVATMETSDDRSIGKMLDAGHAGMYAHGLAAMALAEAYGMTGDSRLRAAAQSAINWIAQSQAAGGFWGYIAGGNDTSVSGWQVMALKSGHAAGLSVSEKTIDGIRRGLDSVAGGGGAYYGYRKPVAAFRPATTAIGLLSRIYTGWPNDHAPLRRGMKEILAKGPDFDDMYYTYYATQAMYQYTSGKGPAWQRYNVAMRNGLVATQARRGHEVGSWNHGRYIDRGGRIYSTALAAMCLEIYYRYEPVYQKSRTFGARATSGFAGSKPRGGPPVDETAAWELE